MNKRRMAQLLNREMDDLEKKGQMLSYQASVEGAILLENNGILPVRPCRVALYGIGARNTIVRGIGSGDIAYRSVINIEEGLEGAGFVITNKKWLDRLDVCYAEFWENRLNEIGEETKRTGIDNLHIYYNMPHRITVYPEITRNDIEDNPTDTAIYVLSRKEGEGCDNQYIEGEYLLAKEEVEQLMLIRNNYEKFILLLNIGSPIDMREIMGIGPDAVFLVYQGGARIGEAVAALLTGAVTPSGKLTSTWAADYWDYPNSKEFGINDGCVVDEIYREGRYIGYRYFETFKVPVQYPFGYGKSYTSFKTTYRRAEADTNRIRVFAEIENTGKLPGKEVIQLYYSMPEEIVDQPIKQICAFFKTKCLQPGEKETACLEFYINDLAVFDSAESAYLLPAGIYYLWMGNSVQNADLSCSIQLDNTVVTRKVRHLFDTHKDYEILSFKGDNSIDVRNKNALDMLTIHSKDVPVTKEIEYREHHPNYFGGKIDPDDVNHDVGGDVSIESLDSLTLRDVIEGSYTFEELVASMDLEELVHLVTGQEYIDSRYLIQSVSAHVPGAAGETTSFFEEVYPERKIPFTVLADGPAGLRLIPNILIDDNDSIVFQNPLLAYEDGAFVESEEDPGYRRGYQYTTGLPNATQLACTWNQALLHEIGEQIGHEMEKYDVDLWLAPGMNLHRNPLGGRSFEYFSEDPLISASTAIALINGVQSVPGRGATIKHLMACNQEAARTSHNSVVDEKTMRDLYAKGFELVIKYANPFAVMTALNCIDGFHGTNNKDIAAYLVRSEWKYDGLIMTDWNTTTPERGANTAMCIESGNDLIMPGSSSDIIRLKAAVCNKGKGDRITLGDLQYCAANVLRYIARTGRVRIDPEENR